MTWQSTVDHLLNKFKNNKKLGEMHDKSLVEPSKNQLFPGKIRDDILTLFIQIEKNFFFPNGKFYRFLKRQLKNLILICKIGKLAL